MVYKKLDEIRSRLAERRNDGGPGSGNFGHSGRPGERGGSGGGGGSSSGGGSSEGTGGTSIKSADKISTKSSMTGKQVTIASIRSEANKDASPKEKNKVIQDAMDLAFDNPANYYDVKDALRASGLDKQFEWEMGPSNTNAMNDVIKPAIEKAKNELKDKIPPPAKNKSSSCVINGQKIEFFNAKNAMYPKSSRSPRFIDIRISDPETGERTGSFAAKDYDSAMEHVYRMAGLNTGNR